MGFSQALLKSLLFFSIAVRDISAKTVEQSYQSTACATISALQRNGDSYFPADTARDCLMSVPLDVTGDALQLQGLRSLVEFQSDLAYLSSPPPGYYYPAIDILGSLEKLGKRLQEGHYKTELDFQLDVYNTIRAAHDTHFYYLPDIVGLFSFELQQDSAPFQIFSISDDGLSLPNIYAFADQQALLHGSQLHYVASPITTIDGQDVEDYLNNAADHEAFGLGYTFQDPDASYNALFPNIPNGAVLDTVPTIGNMFWRNYTYSNNVTSIGFANGTVYHIPIVATTTQDFANITSGNDIFTMFCNRTYDLAQLIESIYESAPSPSTSSNATSTLIPYSHVPTSAVPEKRQIPTYPRPIAIASDNSVSGYFPESQFTDLAVLSLPTYGPADEVEFLNVIREFIVLAQSHNKTKLVIDLRGNSGGSVALLYDVFKKLFPTMTPYGTTNVRANPLLNDFGATISAFFDQNECDTNNATEAYVRGYFPPYEYRLELNAEDNAFSSWKELYGPHKAHGDNFTSLLRYNLSDPFSLQQPVSSLYGYNNTETWPQVFEPENIVLLQDGTCTSACAVFTELMKEQGHVTQIVVGGRKQSGPMQGVGGTKGAQVFDMETIVAGWYAAYIDADPAGQASLNQTYGGPDGWFVRSTGKALARGQGAFPPCVNLRNNIRQGDETRTPLQFVYEAADCRFFYTAAMYSSQETVWNRVYELKWANGICVEGSTGQASSQPGNVALLPFASVP